MSAITDIITQTANRYGLDPQTMLAIGQIESGLRPDAQNPNSSAGGLYQFIDSTWDQYGGGNKYDPARNADAAGRYLSDVQGHLSRRLGRAPTAGELYLGHQQGAGGATKLLSNPNARAADLVGAQAVKLNGADLNVSSAEFAKLWSNKIGKILGQAPQAGGATTDLVYRGELDGVDPGSLTLNPVDRGGMTGNPQDYQRQLGGAPASSLADFFAPPPPRVDARKQALDAAEADMARRAALFSNPL